MDSIIELDSWITLKEIDDLLAIANTWDKVEYTAKEGKFPGKLVATQSWHTWDNNDDLGKILHDRMQSVIGNHRVVELDYVELYLPWDIHCDYERPFPTPNPYYSFLIPLQSFPSRTIFFEQIADYNDFWKYKQHNRHVENCVDLEFWNNNLSHCWDEDRLYLSLQHVSKQWIAGDAICFKRDILHSSDDFYVRHPGPKKFLEILTDTV